MSAIRDFPYHDAFRVASDVFQLAVKLHGNDFTPTFPAKRQGESVMYSAKMKVQAVPTMESSVAHPTLLVQPQVATQHSEPSMMLF